MKVLKIIILFVFITVSGQVTARKEMPQIKTPGAFPSSCILEDVSTVLQHCSEIVLRKARAHGYFLRPLKGEQVIGGMSIGVKNQPRSALQCAFYHMAIGEAVTLAGCHFKGDPALLREHNIFLRNQTWMGEDINV